MVSFTVFSTLSFCLLICVQGELEFVLRNCGKTDFLELKSRRISPYPVEVPGTVEVSGEAELKKWPAGGQYKLDVSIETKRLLWVTVPCVSDVGSCTYDACKMLDTFNKTGCPQQLVDNNIPCTCPTIKPGTYTLTNAKFMIPELTGIWSWLASGDYKVTLKLKDKSNGDTLACLHGELTVKDKDSCDGFLCSVFG